MVNRIKVSFMGREDNTYSFNYKWNTPICDYCQSNTQSNGDKKMLWYCKELNVFHCDDPKCMEQLNNIHPERETNKCRSSRGIDVHPCLHEEVDE